MESLTPIEVVEKKILLIRGKKVMLDRDLAGLYGVETRVLNQAVQRNIRRFPDDFMFALTREEIMRISQIVISSDIKFSKRVNVFTEITLCSEQKNRLHLERETGGLFPKKSKEESVMKQKTNFNIYLEDQLKDPDFAARFKKAGDDWDIAV